MKTLGVAFSGGAAKGLCHVRVYQKLMDEGIKIHSISGASAGALFGAMMAYGYTANDILEIIQSKKFTKLIKNKWQHINLSMFNPFNWIPGIFKLDKFFDFLNEDVFKKSTFGQLKIPMVIVYTDMSSNETKCVYSEHSNVAEYVIHSMTFPIIFKSRNNTFYDGGLKCNCPTKALKMIYNPDYVLAVDVTNIDKFDNMYKFDIISYINRVFDVVWCDTFEEDLLTSDMVIAPDLKGAIRFFDFDKYQYASEKTDQSFTKNKIERLKQDLK